MSEIEPTGFPLPDLSPLSDEEMAERRREDITVEVWADGKRVPSYALRAGQVILASSYDHDAGLVKVLVAEQPLETYRSALGFIASETPATQAVHRAIAKTALAEVAALDAELDG